MAAPTAGLHFTPAVFESLHQKGIRTEYVTLHVGAGTFKPVSTETIGDHYMHEEKIVITEALINLLLNNMGRRRIAVGTTVARTLESLFIIGAKLKTGRPHPLLVEQWEIYDDPALRAITLEDSLTAIHDYLEQQDTSPKARCCCSSPPLSATNGVPSIATPSTTATASSATGIRTCTYSQPSRL